MRRSCICWPMVADVASKLTIWIPIAALENLKQTLLNFLCCNLPFGRAVMCG